MAGNTSTFDGHASKTRRSTYFVFRSELCYLGPKIFVGHSGVDSAEAHKVGTMEFEGKSSSVREAKKQYCVAPAGKLTAAKLCLPFSKEICSYLHQALSHLLRGRLHENAQAGVEVLNRDGSHESSLLLLPEVPVSSLIERDIETPHAKVQDK